MKEHPEDFGHEDCTVCDEARQLQHHRMLAVCEAAQQYIRDADSGDSIPGSFDALKRKVRAWEAAK